MASKNSTNSLKKRAASGEDTSKFRAQMNVGPANTRILIGLEDLSEWDEEELIRGRRRDKDGGFKGLEPVVVPKVVHDEIVKRLLMNAQNQLRSQLPKVIDQLMAVVEGVDVEDKDRLKAIAMIMDRVMGKPTEKVEISVERPKWETALDAIIVTEDEDGVIETTAWQEDEDE